MPFPRPLKLDQSGSGNYMCVKVSDPEVPPAPQTLPGAYSPYCVVLKVYEMKSAKREHDWPNMLERFVYANHFKGIIT